MSDFDAELWRARNEALRVEVARLGGRVQELTELATEAKRLLRELVVIMEHLEKRT